MNNWVMYAFTSMFFAGFTSVIAKKGLENISGDLGLIIRTCFVFIFVVIFGAIVVPKSDLSLIKPVNVLWLSISAATTALSWVFYYKAIKLGDVSTVALIDKGSVIVAVALAFLLLHEAITPPKLIGAALIIAGLIVIARGQG
jgi:transporter family protein